MVFSRGRQIARLQESRKRGSILKREQLTASRAHEVAHGSQPVAAAHGFTIALQIEGLGGAEISGDPRALADALAKIDRYAQGLPLETAETHPATAQMMIINPLSGGGLSGMFSTHPPTEERIRRLLAMAA